MVEEGWCRYAPWLLYFMIVVSVADKPLLNLMGFLPMTGEVWSGGGACLPAMQMGIDHVNARTDILPDYNLNLIWRDTQCNAGLAADMMYQMLYESPTKHLIVGAGCSVDSESTAQSSYLWNLTQISYGSGSPALSDRKRFPRFFRLASPDTMYNPARIALLKLFNWKKIATIHEALDFFSLVTDDLIQSLKDTDMTVLTEEIFHNDPTTQVENLKRHDARIILTGMYANKARIVLCKIVDDDLEQMEDEMKNSKQRGKEQAYQQGLYGPKIVWVFPGWYENYWWRNSLEGIPCTPEEMDKAAEGHLVTGFFFRNPNAVDTISNLTVQEFESEYRKIEGYDKVDKSYEFITAKCYDVIWACALALDCADEKLKQEGEQGFDIDENVTTRFQQCVSDSKVLLNYAAGGDGHNKTLDRFDYADADINDVITACFYNVSFQGISSKISFGSHGELLTDVKIQHVQDYVQEMVGIYHPDLSEKFEWRNGGIKWKGNIIPRDSSLIVVQEAFVSLDLYIAMSTLSAAGILMALIFLVFNMHYRNKRIVKMSSPHMNNVLLLGCIIVYSTNFLRTFDDSNTALICKLRTYFLTFGFSIACGSLFSKTWRVYKIFSNKKMKRVVIKDCELIGIVGLLVVFPLIVLIIWEIIDPQTAMDYEMEDKSAADDTGDIKVRKLVRICVSKYSSYFTLTLYIIEGVLLVFGAFLSWETRKVKLEALNDSQLIGMCIYNVVVLSAIAVTLSIVLEKYVTLMYGITSGFIVLGTTANILIVFIPKVMAVKGSNTVDVINQSGRVEPFSVHSNNKTANTHMMAEPSSTRFMSLST